MSYFQKYQKLSTHSPLAVHEENSQSHDFRKNSESRQSYLKAFKKYYIDKLINQKNRPLQPLKSAQNKQNCQPQDTFNPSKSTSIHKQSVLRDKHGDSTNCSRINPSKLVALVNNNDNQLQELLYSSISQLEREMMGMGQSNDLVRQNKMLKGSIQKLKSILKEKLEAALKKNKEEITLMFDEYSTMIKKLLEDKEKLTSQLQSYKKRCHTTQQKVNYIEREYEERIRAIAEENSVQISSTKQQIEQFLDIIVQYEEEASQEKEELDKLREKVVELELENGQLRKQDDSAMQSARSQNYPSLSDMFGAEDQEIEGYAQKIQNLLNIVDRLQEENSQLNRFLKTCKCSKIKSKSNESFDDTQDYEKRLIQIEKGFIREEMGFRDALRRKDQCIDRLNLVIEEMRKGRYESVDRLTEQMVSSRQIPR